MYVSRSSLSNIDQWRFLSALFLNVPILMEFCKGIKVLRFMSDHVIDELLGKGRTVEEKDVAHSS